MPVPGGTTRKLSKAAGAPAQERIALAVPLVFLLDIGVECARIAEGIDRHRVVDDEVDRNQRIDLARVAAKCAHGVAHRRKIDHGGDAGEILHQHARRAEGDLAVAGPRLEPLCHAADVIGGDRAAVLMAQEIFEQHLQRERQAADAGEPVRLGLLQIEIVIAALADPKRSPAIEAVERGLGWRCQLGLLLEPCVSLARTWRQADDMQRLGQPLGQQTPGQATGFLVPSRTIGGALPSI